MTLLGLPLGGFLLGLAGLATALFGLHLLRIRLRRQTVDSLLFFRQVGTVHKPRVLLGRPSRWLSFLLGLLLLAAAWTAFARPRSTADGPSRVLLVDATAAARADAVGTALATQAAQIVDEAGLGPRGRVMMFGAGVSTVWQAGEPVERLGERLAAEPAGGSPAAVWTALQSAARELGPDDEIVVLGGPAALPDQVGGVPVQRARAPGTAPAAGIAGVRLSATMPRMLEVEVATAGASAQLSLSSGEARIATLPVTAPAGATTVVELGPLADAAAELSIELIGAGGTASVVDVAVPERHVVPVHVAAGLPPSVALAIAADGGLERAPIEGAEAAVVHAGTAVPEGLPALIVHDGVVAAERAPRRTAACPLPLSLRDRAVTGTALPAGDGEVWVEDVLTGAALVRRSGDLVHTVAWLLDAPAHRDVPALVLGSLHVLAPRTRLDVGPTIAPSPGGAAADPELDARGAAWPFVAMFLVLALIGLLADAVLHHRGRIA